MKEPIVSFEVAKLAKEKGFFIWCNQRYKDGKLTYTPSLKYANSKLVKPDQNQIFAPTQSLLQRWLREAHKINSRVASNSLTYHFPINGILSDDGELMRGPSPMKIFKTYEDALEYGLQEALKLIK